MSSGPCFLQIERWMMCGAPQKGRKNTNKGGAIGRLNIVQYGTSIGGILEVPNTHVSYET